MIYNIEYRYVYCIFHVYFMYVFIHTTVAGFTDMLMIQLSRSSCQDGNRENWTVVRSLKMIQQLNLDDLFCIPG